MIETITLKFGSNENSSQQGFSPGTMTVFVGPNNSGKSLVLREIWAALEGSIVEHMKILNGIRISFPDSDEEFESVLRSKQVRKNLQPSGPDFISIGKVDTTTGKLNILFNAPISQVIAEIKSRSNYTQYAFASLFAVKIDGIPRLQVANQQPIGDLLEEEPLNILAILLKDTKLRERVRSIIYDAFGVYAALDVSNGGMVRFRVSSQKPSEAVETGFSQEALLYHSRADLLENQGDGLRCFLGVLLMVMCGDFKIMLLDEPEAFLHPPLAQALGRNLAEIAVERKGNLIVSTHSSSFLLGCVQSGAEVNIVRLTHKNGSSTAKMLHSSTVKTMMQEPVMKSAGVLSALFHDGSIVCEYDTDRVFYQEINERLIVAGRSEAKGSLFLNANGKSALRKIVAPLRQLGIPAAVVADFDLIFEKSDLHPLLDDCHIPEAILSGIKAQRESILKTLDTKEAKKKGLGSLSGDDKAAATDLVNRLAEFGIFVVPTGELESWLPELNIVASSKPSWFWNAMEKLGSDPKNSPYLHAGSGGVWEFVEGLATWISNPTRRGMPT